MCKKGGEKETYIRFSGFKEREGKKVGVRDRKKEREGICK